MAAVVFHELLKTSRKRRRKNEEEVNDYLDQQRKTRRGDDHDIQAFAIASVCGATSLQMRKKRGNRKSNDDRSLQKLWWTNGYQNWTEEQFKYRIRITRDTFNIILGNIGMYLNENANQRSSFSD